MQDFDSPFDLPDVFGSRGRRRKASAAAAKPEFRQPMPGPEFQSLGKQILGTGASGVGYVLGSLDKPGQAVRGVLAGKGPSALANLIPFSDTMGLTGEADKTSGRDLTDAYGITDKRSKGWSAWGAGLAADIATDPLTYATLGPKAASTVLGGALEKQGFLKGMSRVDRLKGFETTETALKSAGLDVAHEVAKGRRVATQPMLDAAAKAGMDIAPNQPLASLASVGLPFQPKFNFGTGARSQAVAQGLDSLGNWARFGNPVGRTVGGLFDKSVGGARDKITQMGWAKHGDPAEQALEAESRGEMYDLLKRQNALITNNPGVSESDIMAAVIAAAESKNPKFSHAIQLASQANPALRSQVDVAGDYVRRLGRKWGNQEVDAGARTLPLNDEFIDYLHRQSTAAGGSKDFTAPGNLYPVSSSSSMARQDPFKNVPLGQGQINKWFNKYAGQGDKAQVARNAKAIEINLTQTRPTFGPLTLDQANDIHDKANSLASIIGKSSEEYRHTPFFTNDLFSTQSKRAAQRSKMVTAARAAIGTATDNARPMVKGGDMVSIPDLLDSLGLMSTEAATGGSVRGALIRAYEGLAQHGAGNASALANLPYDEVRKLVGQFGVSAEHAAQIKHGYSKWSAAEQIKPVANAFDSFTNAFKSLVYPIWFPSHVRNAATATVNNASRGVGWRDYVDQLKTMTGVGKSNLSGINSMIDSLPESQRADALKYLHYSKAGIYGGHTSQSELAGNFKSALQNQAAGVGPSRFTPFVPGEYHGSGSISKDAFDTIGRQGVAGTAKAFAQAARNAASDPGAFRPKNWGSGRLGEILDPVSIRGVGGSQVDNLPAVAAGRTVGTKIEDFFRGALMNSEMRKGASPEMAAKAVNDLHFDYGRLTDFERKFMRRLVPFYTFTRFNAPLQAKMIASRPGFFNAQYKPFYQQTPGEDPYVPKYMASGVSVPLGPAVDGSRQYISKLGLPAEEALERLHFKNGLPDIKATAMDYLGSLNPIIKAPLEQLFNRQLHTQRTLTDLKAPGAASAIGRVFGEDNPQLLSQIFANSPMTRFFSSADKLMDPRKTWLQKAVNLASGARVTDVDIEKQKAIEFRNEIESLMEGHPNLSKNTRFYVRPGDAANLTPYETRLMQAYAKMAADTRAYNKQKKEDEAKAKARIGIR